ncbi:hypothetical protein [Bacteriovorax sp. Seq25_V]|uniref:hypothetical protein n=1 Tax=Bacteriovorax sp. Seq25_V TaxID=1201288 RepID=UPI00038A47F0|nr:hypothetical protein [Bacteriovorax sp. Seq25_V]EQC46254.1 hypothetical protein M900_1625 [Bacteriovorax sp. Seq25_V]
MDMKTKFSDDLTLESEFEDLPPEDFLYDRQGPWPQPSPNHPFGEAPGVLHIPFVELFYWWMMIGSRYVFTWIFMWPVALFKAIMWWKVSPVSDEEFCDYYYNTCYSKFLTDTLTQSVRATFKDYLEEGKNYYVCDFIGMKLLVPVSGVKCEPSIALFEKHDNGIKLIAINLRDYVVDHSDGDLWMLAKYISLQGAANHVIVATHPRLHFPMDAINAITKTAVPKDHILFQLIYPHTELTLKLDWQVLNSKLSLLQNKWWMIYAPFPATGESMRDLVVLGYHGIKDNPSYPKYFYPLMGPQKNETAYGKFHDIYYKVYFDFVSNILAEIPRGDKFVTRWANYINAEMPTFPNGEEIWKEGILNHAVASYIWDITIGHGADHKTYAEIPMNKNPLRVRVASPSYKNPDFKLDLGDVASIMDQTRLILANWLFFKPTNVSLTIDAFYQFNLPKLKDAVIKFREELYKTEKNLPMPNYMPVKDIPASIQY